MRCPVRVSRQPRNIRRFIVFHRQLETMKKMTNNDDSDDDVSDTCSADSSDSDDNEETDTESSDDEDDDEVYHSRSDDSLFDSDGDTTFCIIQVRNIVYAVDLIPMIMF